ncbi:MAG: phosphate acyltransferase [candidate division WOR-3 bacterium]|nr:phosphate acyltransferase [candidate division WOR-3 bacterium]
MAGERIRSINKIIKRAKEIGPVNCVVASAYRESEVKASIKARDSGLIKPLFIGDPELPQKFKSINEDEVIQETDPERAAVTAVKLMREGKGDILLKGSVPTNQFLKPILDSETGLKRAPLLSHIVILDIPGLDRLLCVTDGGLCISPGLNEKLSILRNGVGFMHSLGIELPRVGILSAIEKVNPKIENTIDAAIIEKACERGQIPGCEVDGPLAFDLMVSREACKIKGVESSVCGNVDLILVPDLTTGNSIAKALILIGGAKAAGAILGTTKPVVMLSRADSPELKLNSIALGVVMTGR